MEKRAKIRAALFWCEKFSLISPSFLCPTPKADNTILGITLQKEWNGQWWTQSSTQQQADFRFKKGVVSSPLKNSTLMQTCLGDYCFCNFPTKICQNKKNMWPNPVRMNAKPKKSIYSTQCVCAHKHTNIWPCVCQPKRIFGKEERGENHLTIIKPLPISERVHLATPWLLCLHIPPERDRTPTTTQTLRNINTPIERIFDSFWLIADSVADFSI